MQMAKAGGKVQYQVIMSNYYPEIGYKSKIINSRLKLTNTA